MEYINEFHKQCRYIHNKEHEVFDAVPNNVLYGIDNEK